MVGDQCYSGFMDSAGERERLIEEERRKIRRLQLLVDLTANLLYQDGTLSLQQARAIVRGTEKAVLRMFPDKQFTFDLVLLPRFSRILRERWGAGLDDAVH